MTKTCGYENLMKTSKAIVTGASSGIGLAVCEKLISMGTHVYAITRNPEKIAIRENLFPLKLDLSIPYEVSKFGERFIHRYGIPDLLINNAGYGAFFEWNEFPIKQIEKQINVLFTSPVILCKFFAPLMRESKGVIINISSLATLYPLPYMPIYNAGKSALSSFTQSMIVESSNELRWIDFRFGDINTGFNDSAFKQDIQSQSQSMRNAWNQIDKQLVDSPDAEYAASQIIQSIKGKKAGTLFGGNFFQSRMAPILRIFLSNKMLINVLKHRYKIGF